MRRRARGCALALTAITALGAAPAAADEDYAQDLASEEPVFSADCGFGVIGTPFRGKRDASGRLYGAWTVPRVTADLSCGKPMRSLVISYTLVGPSGERVDLEDRCSGDLAGALLGPPSATCTRVSIAPVTLRCTDCAGTWLYYRTWHGHYLDAEDDPMKSSGSVECSNSNNLGDVVTGTYWRCESLLYIPLR